MLLRIRGDAVPAALIFHKTDAFTLDRGPDQGLRLPVHLCIALIECIHDLLHIIAVKIVSILSERPELLAEVSVRHDLVGRTIKLQMVHVDKRNHIIELILMCGIGSFPDLAFLGFAVADHAEYLVLLLVHLAGDTHTHRAGKSVSDAIVKTKSPIAMNSTSKKIFVIVKKNPSLSIK